MSIPYTREVAEIVALFSPSAAQVAHIATELTPAGSVVRVQMRGMRGRIFNIAMVKATPSHTATAWTAAYQKYSPTSAK